MNRNILLRTAFTLLLFAGIFLFLWLGCPEYLMYQEQYQLFLFTGDYFAQRISEPGGLADYISEFIVQFYYVPLYGALLTSLALTLCQVFLGLACRRSDLNLTAYALSALIPIFLAGALSNENILLSYAIALLLTTLFIFLDSLRRKGSAIADTIAFIAGFSILYWAAGAVAFAYIPATCILRRSPLAATIALAVACLEVFGLHILMFEQYPLARLLAGINYCRIPEMYPAMLFIIAGLIPSVALTTLIKVKTKTDTIAFFICGAATAIFAIIYIPGCFNAEKSRVLAYDSLVRRGRWNEIIEKADKEHPQDIFSLQALNLALGMTGRLTADMFKYDQKGIEGLIGRDRLDNTTQLVTAEALYRLGLTNIAFSTTFDLQEAIMNDRKSGRFMKRMAECMIINGNYKVAEKYIGMLRNSLFYAEWANDAAGLLYNDREVEAHPVYGKLRRHSFKQEAFYTQPYIERILAILAVDSEGSNPLAWQYFCAAAMLKGDLQTLAGVYNSSAHLFPEAEIPRHVQEALAMFWTFGHQSFEGIPFGISPDVQSSTATLAQTAMKYPDNPSAWQAAAPGSFGPYFLNLQRLASQSSGASADYISTHE